MLPIEPTGILSTLNSVLSGLGITIGDAIPNYPIKTTEVYNGVVSDLKEAFPPPTSKAMASEQLKAADYWISEANRKIAERGGNSPVDATYKMMTEELKVAIGMYLVTGKFVYPAWDAGKGGQSLSTQGVIGMLGQAGIQVPGYTGGVFGSDDPDPDRTKNNDRNTILIVVVIAVVLFLTKK